MEAQVRNAPTPHWSDGIVGRYLKFAASGYVSAGRYLPQVLPLNERRARTGKLTLEVVSHCWQYSHFLAFQLSSLVQFPPRNLSVIVTVYYCKEDKKTSDMLAFFEGQRPRNVHWNWRAIRRQDLFRRAIGRNHAARSTSADWIWFTDCDLMFREACLDTLADLLQGRRDALVHPLQEQVTPLLADDHPLLNTSVRQSLSTAIRREDFYPLARTRATGPLQIVHGDVARAHGYCECLPLYQTPSETWCKAHEDRAFRWLLRTGGTGLDIPGVYRIRHASKGRYTGSRFNSGLRGGIRRFTSWLYEVKHQV